MGSTAAAPTAAPAAAPMPVPGDLAFEEKDQAAGGDGNVVNQPAQPDPQQQAQQRLIIKNANVELEVESVRDAEAAVRAKVEQMGGYVVQGTTQGTDQYMRSIITFRVPAERFEETLAGVQGLAKRVLARTISGDDVTEEFVDLESRMRNLEATRTRLLDLLEKATRVEDALNVNNALTQVQGEIEQIKGRMQYLQQSAALSTITLTLVPVPVTPIVEEGGWQPETVARRALRGLLEFGQGLAELAIVLVIWSPVWLVLFFVGRWIWRKLARMASKPISPAKPAVPSDTPPAAGNS